MVKKSFALIFVLIVIVVLAVLGGAMLSRSISEAHMARRAYESSQAFWLAEAGINYGLAQLKKGDFSGSNSSSLSGNGSYSCSWGPKAGSTTIWQIDSTGKINSTGFFGGTNSIARIVHVEVQKDTFARYAYFTDDEYFRWFGWRIPVWFVTNDYVGGPLQTNSYLHISGNPVFTDTNFHKPVKTAGSFLTYMNGGWPYGPINSTASSNPPNDEPDFQEGIQLGADEVPFPRKALDLRTAAAQDGYEFKASNSHPAKIILNNDGTMTVTDLHHTNETMPLPGNGAVFVEGGDTQISGVLSGQLSIGTNRDIVVTDNIIYNDDPRTNPGSTDTLALIAEKDVVISDDAPYNTEIDASIMALGDSFTVENWWKSPAKGTLTVYGGVIQRDRGPVGTFDSRTNSKQSGYSKDYQYDSRLLANPPPFYPTTGDYVVVSWEEIK